MTLIFMKLFKGQKGFSLIELIVVIVIIGILSYVVTANYNNSYTSVQYQTMIHKIAADVRYARESAVTGGQGTSVFVDPSHNQYYLKWADGSYLQNPNKGGNFIVELGKGDAPDVQITQTTFSGGRLDFNKSGAPLNAGNPYSGKLTLLVLNNAKKVTVTANTGYIKIEDM